MAAICCLVHLTSLHLPRYCLACPASRQSVPTVSPPSVSQPAVCLCCKSPLGPCLTKGGARPRARGGHTAPPWGSLVSMLWPWFHCSPAEQGFQSPRLAPLFSVSSWLCGLLGAGTGSYWALISVRGVSEGCQQGGDAEQHFRRASLEHQGANVHSLSKWCWHRCTERKIKGEEIQPYNCTKPLLQVL